MLKLQVLRYMQNLEVKLQFKIHKIVIKHNFTKNERTKYAKERKEFSNKLHVI